MSLLQCSMFMEKAHESSIKEAISKAVYHYLKCDKEV
jgi:hypothetical protein